MYLGQPTLWALVSKSYLQLHHQCMMQLKNALSHNKFQTILHESIKNCDIVMFHIQYEVHEMLFRPQLARLA
jgi:hypothetical protein